MTNTVLIVGASGLVGTAAALEFLNAGWRVMTASRRFPELLEGSAVEHITLDLMDAAACKAAAASLKDATHIVYAALYEQPGLIAGWQAEEQMQTNLAMLDNLLSAFEQSSSLRHVTLLQGTKAYGAHVAPMRIPGREREPRHQHANFYWLQEDYLRDKAAQRDWQFTIWRPQVIFGHALHAPMNMLAALGAYAALQRHQGLPFAYPGGPAAVAEAIDADLLARAIHFSFDSDAFAGETFNITNGDVYRFSDLWPDLAGIFDMEEGEPTRRVLSATLYDMETTWAEIVGQHGLRPYSLRELVGDSFYYADALLNTGSDMTPPPALLSTIKLRQAGFNECIDTIDMFARWYDKLAALKVLPRF